ncbi:hypothetical protein V2J09_002151 [Rumex salicifolius]
MTYVYKKRHRSLNQVRLSSAVASVDVDVSDGTLVEVSQKLPRISSSPAFTGASSSSFPHIPPPIPGGFNDPSTADVILRLYVEIPPFDAGSGPIVELDPDFDICTDSELQLFVHSSVLRRAKYFGALLSDRWTGDVSEGSSSSKLRRLNLGVAPGTGSIHAHVVVIRLLYTEDFATVINSISSALSMLPIALKLLFEDCIKECVRFLESVPWSEEEEARIMDVIPLLGEDESKDLLARVSPPNSDASEIMLQSLIITALHNHSNVAAAKAFVASLLRDFPSRETASSVLERIFSICLKSARSSLEDYSSPDLRGNHGETEAIQRLNLHTTLTKCKQLLWLVERMIELKVAHSAVKEWSEQATFAADLQRAFREDAWRNIAPGLPNMVLKCMSKLAVSVASGTILAPRQVRKQLVENWLPVLIVCKDNAFAAMPHHKPALYSFRSLHPELEDAFLKIISTLPMAEAQELLQQCLSFSTRDSEGCAHLVKAFDTWFRRAATRSPLP